MFVIPSFEIHGSVKGLFDLGPPACGLKANIIDIWRKHFVLNENMLEVSVFPPLGPIPFFSFFLSFRLYPECLRQRWKLTYATS